jgi:hypothetical protein
MKIEIQVVEQDLTVEAINDQLASVNVSASPQPASSPNPASSPIELKANVPVAGARPSKTYSLY